VAGVPPDYFSEDGQRWGNPHYRWDLMKERGYAWWLSRLRCAAERFDAVRLDHFIGFQRFWEIPASCKTAKEGKWVAGPGADFFAVVTKELDGLELIAEDLGSITPEVAGLRDKFDLPGMRVLQFAFGGDQQATSFLPRNYPRRTVAYTGTHDNDTTLGWYATAPEIEKHHAREYLKTDGREINWDMIAAISRSTADTAVVPVQDALSLGAEARMNRPGTAKGNWAWRLVDGQLTKAVAARLRAETSAGGRIFKENP
jgi:4-alpha-glucanotransferase